MNALRHLSPIRIQIIYYYGSASYFLSYFIEKYSDNGPNARAGKNESAATMMITAKTITPNVPVSVFKVPALSGTNFFFARMPAMASGPMMGRNLESNMIIPSLIFQNGEFALKPPNSDPLLADAELNSYNISEKPWLPGLFNHP